jgi:Peptidase family M1 domain
MPPPVAPEAAPPKGTVIFHKEQPVVSPDETDAPEQSGAASSSSSSPASSSSSSSSSQAAGSAAQVQPEPSDAAVEVTDEEREALTFTGYDLDVHLVPASSAIEVHAGLKVRNDGGVALKRLAIQLSSSLAWESFGLRTASGVVRLAFVQHRINTDADHTGVSREAVVTLPEPLAAGGRLELVALYGGTIKHSAERLERIGAPAEQAAAADWDAISGQETALRGYGDVLWYPVAGAPVFLGDGAKLFDAVGRAKMRQQDAMTRLRLTVNYTGDAPDAVFFCGRRQPLTTVSDNEALPVAESSGVATVEFAARPLGFRVPSLFLTEKAPTRTDGGLIDAVTDQFGVLRQIADGAAKAQPLLMNWLGPTPVEVLHVIDHEGQPFEDGAFLVAPLRGGDAAALAPVLVHTLSHAWFPSSHVWLDEGVAQLMSLLWVESNHGREAAIEQLQSADSALALAEPEAGAGAETGKTTAGQSLIGASSEVYYRTKAAAVLWMLRSIAGEDALKQTFVLYRRNRALDANAEGFENLLEETSHKDLRWFFDDWVYHDRGLPDLSIAHIAPRQVDATGGKRAGWLIAVGVRNDGDAVAEVPVTVRSGELTATETLRIPGHSDAATRILFQGTPETVEVNDGSVPEVRSSVHSEKVILRDANGPGPA